MGGGVPLSGLRRGDEALLLVLLVLPPLWLLEPPPELLELPVYACPSRDGGPPLDDEPPPKLRSESFCGRSRGSREEDEDDEDDEAATQRCGVA